MICNSQVNCRRAVCDSPVKFDGWFVVVNFVVDGWVLIVMLLAGWFNMVNLIACGWFAIVRQFETTWC